MKALDILYGFDETCFVDIYLNEKSIFLSLELQIVESIKKYITVKKVANVITYAEQIGSSPSEIWSVLLYIVDQLPKEKLHAYEDILYGYCSKQVISYNIAKPYLTPENNLYSLDNVLLCIQGSTRPMDILVSRLASNYFEDYLFQYMFIKNMNWLVSDEFYHNMMYYRQQVETMKNISYVDSKIFLTISSHFGYNKDYLFGENYEDIVLKLSRLFDQKNISLEVTGDLFSKTNNSYMTDVYLNKEKFLLKFAQLKEKYDN